MWGGGTYEYLGPVGNNASYIFGANFGNKNGIGVVIDPAKESWNPLMDDLVSRNPDGTLEWCGPYAKDKNAANGTGGWPGNNEIATNSTQINYTATSFSGCSEARLLRMSICAAWACGILPLKPRRTICTVIWRIVTGIGRLR